MAPKFGTSGLRGLVTELTPALVADHVRAFLRACPSGTGLFVGHDLRESSPDLAKVVLETGRSLGLQTVDCGAVPTPALALCAMQAGASAIMVTGSHIPADRNGLKFYTPSGEITKSDETTILSSLGALPQPVEGPETKPFPDAGQIWVNRYLRAFGPNALSGLRLGVWAHSAVSRDLLHDAVRSMGAQSVDLGRTDHFVPVDTEAVPEAVRVMLADWVRRHELDAILSTDGDGDRPLLIDETGQVIAGDVLGQLTAAALGSEIVVTPVSSNSGVVLCGRFREVIRTRIGSPFVISAMDDCGPGKAVVGYEANGGFLLGFEAQGPAGPIAPLATRDSLLPLVAVLAQSRRVGPLSALVSAEPDRVTATDRLEHVSVERSRSFLASLEDPVVSTAFFAELGEKSISVDRTDGLRFSLASGRVLHMRPSGNAPEFRLYVEAERRDLATDLLRRGLAILSARLR